MLVGRYKARPLLRIRYGYEAARRLTQTALQ
jgi:hypothetical protein